MTPRGMTLLELMLVVAIVAILTSLSAVAIGPLAMKFRTRQGAETVAQVLTEAQARARATGRCQRVELSTSPSGTRLVIEQRPDANCQVAADRGAWSTVATKSMPNGITATLDPASALPEFRPSSRTTSGGQITLRVGAAPDERLVLVSPQGAICVTEARSPAPCP